MKKFWETVIFVLSTFALVSCGGDENVQCENVGEWMCPGSEVTLCANEKKGTAWFEYDDEKYKCKGSGSTADCSEAAQTIVMDCMGL